MLPTSRRRTTLSAVIGALVLLALSPIAGAAKFGVGDVTGDPPGYFVLTGPQLRTGFGNFSWGDNRHALDLFIEVTGLSVKVEIYDPGLVGASGTGLDAYYNGDVGQVTYTLLDPTGAVLATQAYGSDDVTTDRAQVLLYDGPTTPGLHRLEVRMLDTATTDEDINAFGVSVGGYDMYSYSFTGGEVNLSGGTITQPLVTYPWLVHSTPGTLGGQPLTGVDVATLDLDSATSPPDVRLDTPTGRGVDLTPSPDNGLFVTNLRGLDVGPLDCSDYGVFRLGVDRIGSGNEGGNDINIFTSQLYDYNAGVTPGEFPIAPGDARRPVRIYYPRDDGSAPLKESLVQTGRIVAGSDPPTPGSSSTIEVRVEMLNPSPYDLSSVDLVTRVAANPTLGLPTVTATSPGLAAAVVGREIRVTGDVPAGITAFVTYEVTFTPSAIGTIYLTGDGTDLQGGALPTEALYATPFEAVERMGPICMLRIEAVAPTCSARAVISGNLSICEGDDVVLDASRSTMVDCPGVAEYRWLRDGVEIQAFPAPSSITDAPVVDSVYELEVRCDAIPSCLDSSAVTVFVEPDVPPPAIDDSLRVDEEWAGFRFSWTPGGAQTDHLRQHIDRRFDRPTSSLLTSTTTGDYFLPRAFPRPFHVDYYLVFAVNCAGTEGL